MHSWDDDIRGSRGSGGAPASAAPEPGAFRGGLLDGMRLPQRVSGGLLDGALLRPVNTSAIDIAPPPSSAAAGAMPSVGDILAAMLSETSPACCGSSGAPMDPADAAGRRAGFRTV